MYSLFSCVGFRCPENYNCADFIMKILSDGNKSVNSICDEFSVSKQSEVVKNAIANEIYFVSIVILYFIKYFVLTITMIILEDEMTKVDATHRHINYSLV